jgi:hypothetical protein
LLSSSCLRCPRRSFFKKPTVKEVHEQLTPFLYDEDLEKTFDGLLERRKATIQKIRKLIADRSFSANNVVKIINEDPEEALNAIISVMGLSQEEFFRHRA